MKECKEKCLKNPEEFEILKDTLRENLKGEISEVFLQ